MTGRTVFSQECSFPFPIMTQTLEFVGSHGSGDLLPVGLHAANRTGAGQATRAPRKRFCPRPGCYSRQQYSPVCPQGRRIREQWPLPSAENSLVHKQGWLSHQRPKSQQVPGVRTRAEHTTGNTYLPAMTEASA